MYKKAKITNIVLFLIVLAIQVLNVIMFFDSIRLKNSGDADALALIVLLPLFIIGTIIVLVISIIMLVVCKRASKKITENTTPVPKLLKILTWIAWAFVIVDFILFALIYIV